AQRAGTAHHLPAVLRCGPARRRSGRLAGMGRSDERRLPHAGGYPGHRPDLRVLQRRGLSRRLQGHRPRPARSRPRHRPGPPPVPAAHHPAATVLVCAARCQQRLAGRPERHRTGVPGGAGRTDARRCAGLGRHARAPDPVPDGRHPVFPDRGLQPGPVRLGRAPFRARHAGGRTMIELFEHAVPVLIEGFWITLRIGLFSVLFASLLGLGAALMRTTRHPLVSGTAFAYSTVFRGTPLLIQLFLLYYGIGTLDFVREQPALWWLFSDGARCAILAIALNSGAYMSEAIR